MAMWAERMTQEAPVTVQLLEQAEQLFLGPTADLTLNPVVQDVFAAMRVAGLILLAFCTVISLAELAESSITGTGGGLVGWFKRFFVSVLMTFGGLQFYGLWVRLFNAMLVVFRDYLDSHWTGTGEGIGAFYLRMIAQIIMGHGLLAITLAVITLLILVVLWFLVGGVRQAELILSMVIAPLVWPLYLVPSVEDIPKTALRGFLGLNALLLLTVAMVRMAIRMSIATGEVANIWQLVPALSMLIMTIFLPATIKRIVGQGHSGVGALVTAVQLAAGLKFLSLGMAGGTAAASAPAAGAVPQTPAGGSAYPVAPVAAGGMAPVGAAGGASYQQARVTPPPGLPVGGTGVAPLGLEAPPAASDMCIDIGESAPGSGRFDQVIAMRRYRQGMLSFHPRKEQDDDQGGDR